MYNVHKMLDFQFMFPYFALRFSEYNGASTCRNCNEASRYRIIYNGNAAYRNNQYLKIPNYLH